MRAGTGSRNALLVTVIVFIAFAALGCDRQEQRITAPTTPARSLSTATLPQNYAWQVTLTGDSTASCDFNWSWQLADGSTVAGGSTGCAAPWSGNGSIPPGATGIVVNGSLSDRYDPAPCATDSKTVTKSLNGSENTSVNINLSVGGAYKAPDFFGNSFHVKCPSADAGFTLTLS